MVGADLTSENFGLAVNVQSGDTKSVYVFAKKNLKTIVDFEINHEIKDNVDLEKMILEILKKFTTELMNEGVIRSQLHGDDIRWLTVIE